MSAGTEPSPLPGGVRVAAASARGAAHIRHDLPNQDAYGWRPHQASAGDRLVVAVADGHGSPGSFRSDRGARLAVASALDVLGARSVPPRLAAAGPLPRALTQQWRERVEADLAERPFGSQELERVRGRAGPGVVADLERNPLLAYGATLLAVVVTPGTISYLQLGDGDIVVVDRDGLVHRPLPPDPLLVGDETTSLCRPEAWRDVRLVSVATGVSPRLVLLATDGYANSFSTETGFLQAGPDLLALIDERGLPAVADQLGDWLAETTEHGAGDDVTLALLAFPGSTGSASSGKLVER